ncbi:IS1595 family transposase [Methyloferula stellata]|uniref:IS1595 family transposase n=1 Tax=Methyloferula stellata TaxID=876270 RepID=UPI000360A1DC|nr:IS1595 family transposase [Methyloferula stellata]
MTSLSEIRFHDEDAARAHIEASRWPDAVNCPLCGSLNVMRMGGKTQAGMFLCRDCRGKFTCCTGTVMERSHVPLHKWLLAIHLLSSSKKGMSAHQLMRNLGLGSYRTAWFLAHRIREAMAPAPGSIEPIGGAGKTVEADETYLGKSPKTRRKPDEKPIQVVSLVERGGQIRSMVDHTTVRAAHYEHLDFASNLMTDGSQSYKNMLPVGQHHSVDHSKYEWARGDVHTNTLESFFSVFKRGLVGTYQHVDKKHLHRYLAEFDFRYNNRSRVHIEDAERAARALKGAEGKRLTYRQPHQA